MKQKITLIGAGMLLALAGNASDLTVTKFPPQSAPARERAAKNPMRAPLNADMDKGTKIFGYTTDDFDGPSHYVTFYSENPRQLNKLSEATYPDKSFDQTLPRNVKPQAGAWCGEAYYTYRLRHYSFGMLRLDNWQSVDTETGEKTELCAYEDGVSWWPDDTATGDGLFWNPNSPEDIFMLAKNNDGTVTSVIWTVDPENGEFVDKVATLDQYYFSAAYSYDNKIYALRWKGGDDNNIVGTVLDVLDPEDDFFVESSTELLVDGKPFRIYYTNNIAFDYTTGDLWWAACSGEDNATPILVKIDPVTKTTENKGTFGVLESVAGLYIPYVVADDRRAPARVEKMSFTVDPAGANKVTLNWTNPTTQWNRNTLKSLTEVLIFRDNMDGAPVATLDATGKVGAPMSWTDETASKGVHTYYIVACATKGVKGVPRSIDAFVGRDVPGPVQNLTATTTDGKKVNLTWTAPVKGDNDGWFDASALSYTITRLPDNKVLGTVKGTSYTDDASEDVIMSYSYVVTAANADGQGTGVTSEPVLAGSSVMVPFSTDFNTKIDADRFTSIDKNGDGRAYIYDYNTNISRNTYKLEMSTSNDDMLVSPPLKLEKDARYKVTFETSYGGYGHSERRSTHHIALVGGKTPTADGMTDVLDDKADYQLVGLYPHDTYVAFFNAKEDGEYYVALNTLTANESDIWQYVEGFSIEKIFDDDLAVDALDTHLILSSIEDNIFNVTVRNNGKNAHGDFKVKVAYLNEEGQPVVFAQTEDVPELPGMESDIVELKGKPADVIGNAKVVAIVELATDGNRSNDVSAPVNVVIEEADAFTNTVTNPETESVSTSVPFHHFNNFTATQTIYTPAMTGMERLFKDKKVKVSRVAWEYEGKAFIDGTKLDVYLTQADRGYFSYPFNGQQWCVPTGKANFSDEVRIEKGHHYVSVDFDEPVEISIDKPFAVTVNKSEQGHSDFLMEFATFDGSYNTEEYHSMIYTYASPIDITSPQGNGVVGPEAPVLHLSVKGASNGIDEIALTGEGCVYYNGQTGRIESVNFILTSVSVYDLTGALVKQTAADGRSAALNCAAGVYVIKAVSAEGKVVTLKVNVK